VSVRLTGHRDPRLTTSQTTGTSRDAEHSLVVRDCVKHFGRVKANDGLNLEFASAELHALLGENGAGKSTLIKILAGIYDPDAGTISLDGEPVALDDAMAARRAGISVVHQDSTLVPPMTVLENVVLQEGGLGPIADDLGDRLRDSGRRLGFELDPRARVESLTPGDRQRVEIARALMADARFLILDEPTAVLSPQEKVTFFELLEGLAADGIGVIVVTHHIGDALRYCTRLTVLRAGRVVGESRQRTEGMTEEQVIHMMVGDIELAGDGRVRGEPGEEVLRVTDLAGRLEGARALEGVTLSVRAGEVLGIAGVEGDGQRELAAALTGAWQPEQGTVELKGRPLSSYSSAERAGMIADVPDDQLLGTIPEISVWENIGLTQLAWHKNPTPAQGRKLRRTSSELVEEFGIRTAGVGAPVGQLSGGNRRRVVLARELSKEPVLAILAFATKGLDVRSVEQLKGWTRRLAAAGTAVVYISADLEEVLAVSDRIAVMAHGEITGTLDAGEADVQRIGRLMLGGTHREHAEP
jgi:general nucleoside transport system ATP-binding protein